MTPSDEAGDILHTSWWEAGGGRDEESRKEKSVAGPGQMT
jgi:hypothetical protein